MMPADSVCEPRLGFRMKCSTCTSSFAYSLLNDVNDVVQYFKYNGQGQNTPLHICSLDAENVLKEYAMVVCSTNCTIISQSSTVKMV